MKTREEAQTFADFEEARLLAADLPDAHAVPSGWARGDTRQLTLSHAPRREHRPELLFGYDPFN